MNKIGQFGENIATNYLIKNHYYILNRNKKVGFDEIDIIALDIHKTLVFFEVKTMRPLFNSLMPEDNFSFLKRRKVIRACEKFASRNPSLINEERGWRIDLIAITLRAGGRYGLNHYKNV